jgi:hypothetical protein
MYKCANDCEDLLWIKQQNTNYAFVASHISKPGLIVNRTNGWVIQQVMIKITSVDKKGYL